MLSLKARERKPISYGLLPASSATATWKVFTPAMIVVIVNPFPTRSRFAMLRR